MRRVVVTGMGVVSPLGNNLKEFWQNISTGQSGISKVTRFDTSEFSTKIAGEVKNFETEGIIEKKELRKMDLFCQYALVAADQAIKQAKLNTEKFSERTGVIVGCGIGGFQTIENQYRNLLEKGPAKVSPFTIPMIIPNMAAGQIAIKYGLRGPNFCSVTACASGANAIGDAFRLIKNNEADIVICGGTEAPITPLGFAGFCSARAMSRRNDEPEKACRPFSLDRDGFVMGEGAGIIVLEELNHAKVREVEIFGEISGYGTNGDAHHITAPEPEGNGVKNAMLLALRDAGLKSAEIDYINAHGTSTQANDKTETLAIKKVFDPAKILVSSTKSMTGHLLGAAGGIEAIISLLAIRESLLPPTINYEIPDPECDLQYVPNKALNKVIENVLSNSLGFGGHNTSLIFRKYREKI